jgi:hypothetical protein
VGLLAFAPTFPSAVALAAARPAETVILVEPTEASAATRQSLSRIKDELAADRFEVVLAMPTPATEPGALIESKSPGLSRATFVILFGDAGMGRSELCVVRRAGQRTAIRRALVVDLPERMPQTLSLRALELLRATALELSIDTVEPSPPQEPQGPPRTSQLPAGPVTGGARRAPTVTLDVGLASMHSLDGPPPMLAPIGRLQLGLASWLYGRLSAAGLGTRPSVKNVYGSATLSQNLALLELVTVLRSEEQIRPMASLGVGALSVSIEGTGAAPYQGRGAHQWSAAIDAGLGVALAFGSRSAAVTELHALLALPHPVVRFVNTSAATIGYPSLMLTLALQVSP